MAAPETEWVDALDLLEASMAALSPGQMVKSEEMPLAQLMSAIEIMDPRTDSYMSAQPKSSDPSLFDPARQLLPQELLWLIDELLRLEMSYFDGHPIGSTLWACLYLRPAALAQLNALIASQTSSATTKTEYTTLVLRAMLLGVLKCAECTWSEHCVGQVYEHEDVHLSLSSLSFTTMLAAGFHPPLPEGYPTPAVGEEEPVSVDNVLRTLEQARVWLQDRIDRKVPGVDLQLEGGLCTRVRLRIDLLYAQALLASPPHTSPAALLPPLQRMKASIPVLAAAPSAFSSPLTHRASSPPLPESQKTALNATPADSSAPARPTRPDSSLTSSSTPHASEQTTASPELLAVFSPAAAAALASSSPPRAVDAFSLPESWNRLLDLTKDLEGAVKGWENWLGPAQDGRGGGWKEAKEYSMACARRAMSPYAMSVHQTILLANSTVFGIGSVLLLTAAFFEATTGLPESVWGMLRLVAEREDRFGPDAPARQALGWADKVGRALAQDLARGTQNRARQRRNIVKNRDALLQLTLETAKVLPALTRLLDPSTHTAISLLAPALHALQMSAHLEALLSGFELDLFDESEQAGAYFVAARTAAATSAAWQELVQGAQGAGAVGYRLAKRQEAVALEGLAWGAMRGALLFPEKKIQLASLLPTLGLKEEARVELEKSRWEQRFGWLRRSAQIDWDLFEQERVRVKEAGKREVAREAQLAFDEATEALASFARIPFAERGGGGAGRPELPIRWLAALRRTAVQNSAAFGKLAGVEEGEFPESCAAVFDAAWFPIWKC